MAWNDGAIVCGGFAALAVAVIIVAPIARKRRERTTAPRLSELKQALVARAYCGLIVSYGVLSAGLIWAAIGLLENGIGSALLRLLVTVILAPMPSAWLLEKIAETD